MFENQQINFEIECTSLTEVIILGFLRLTFRIR